ncbi:MAG: hypothetical protein ACREIV_00725, partial [Planctomycetaceae bacterium]
PGTILDAPAGLEYDFPAKGLDAANFVTVLKAELRSIAARLVMPEYMFTSDASNSNYASTVAAEAPALKMFERLQTTIVTQDREVINRVLANAAATGRLPENVHQLIEVNIRPPTLQNREPIQAARINEIAHRAGVLSPQTWAQKLDIDYDIEQAHIDAHRRTAAPPPQQPPTTRENDPTRATFATA